MAPPATKTSGRNRQRGASSTAQPVPLRGDGRGTARASSASSVAVASGTSGVTTRRGKKRAAAAAAAAATDDHTTSASQAKKNDGRMAGGMDDGRSSGRSGTSGRRSRSHSRNATHSASRTSHTSQNKKKSTSPDTQRLREAVKRVRDAITALRSGSPEERGHLAEAVRDEVTNWLPLHQRANKQLVASDERATLGLDGESIIGVVVKAELQDKGSIPILMRNVIGHRIHVPDDHPEPPKVNVLIELNNIALCHDLVAAGIPFVNNANRSLKVPVTFLKLDPAQLNTVDCSTFVINSMSPSIDVNSKDRMLKFFNVSSISYGTGTRVTVVLRNFEEAKIFAEVFHLFYLAGTILWLTPRVI